MSNDLMSRATTVLRGARFDVCAVELPGHGGATVRREVVVHPGAVVILPMLDGDTVALIRNQRFAVGDTLWELPAGTLEPPESPDVCAERELIEETGYKAARIDKLTSFYTSPGICTELMHAYVATGLTHVGQDLDESERITVEPVKLTEAMRMIRTGEIRDGKTIATLLFYTTFVRKSG